MKIYYYNGTLWKDVTALDSSFCEETIDRFSRISLDFVLPSEELVPELCHVTWRGDKYTLYTVPKVVKVSTREYRYTLILEGRYKELERTLVKDKLGRTKFVFTGRADQYADLISGCIDGWSTGTCTTGDRTQVIAFSNNSLLDACRMVASKFETEVQLDGGKIAFGRVEKYKGDSLTLAYRQGLQKEITTEPDSKETALGRLYVMGGDRNIDPAKYGSRTLHLPKGGSLSVEGHTFRVDASGRYISLEGDTRLNTSERALDATTIYPKRVGTISKVEQKGDEWDVLDDANTIDYGQHRVGGDVMRLEFQSGRLAGRSFDLTTKDDKLTGYVHAEKRFRLVRREIDGVLMPEPATFFPAAGDKYAIFGCSLPDEYIKSAEAEMLSTAAKYMAERLEARVQYRAELDGLWAKKNWSTVAHKLTIGTIVRLEGAANDVRISSVRTSLNSPYTPRITFSNAPYMVGSLTTQIAGIESAEVRTREETRQSLLSLRARTYEDTKVVREMIERLRVEGFTQAIKPETLQSMYAVIGSPALQFDFVRGGGSVPFSWSEGKGGAITIPGQSMRRKGSGTTLEPGDKTTVIDVPALTYTLKAEERQAYVYTELSPAPHFVISTKPLAINPDRLLVGLLNGEEGKRAFTPLYGFTEITPGQLKTDLIRSQDGKSYWDLLSGKFATTGDLLIGDPKGDTCLAYIDGVLYVKGLTVSVGSSSTTIEDALREQERKIENAKKIRQPIIKNGTWWVWDDTTNQLIDSGKPAQGATGAKGEKGEQGEKGDPGKDVDPKVLNDLKAAVDDARRKLDDTVTKAELDGVVSAQEEHDIQAAKAALDAAKKAYDDAVKKAKELDGEIQVGGRNLLLKSDTAYSNTDYMVALYDIADPSQMVEGETYTIRIWGEAEGADFSESLWVYNSGGNTEVANIQQRTNGAWTQTIKWREDRNKKNSFVYIFRGANVKAYSKESKTTITRVKLERGSVATDWTPAPEDVQAEIEAAKEQATKAQQSTDKLRGYVDGAFRDGVVDDAEAKAIKTYINEVDAQWQSALGAYEKVYQNPLLTGTPKTALLDCKTTLAGKCDALTQYIATAIADGRATTAEVDGVNFRYNVYKGALRDFQKALKVAEQAIRDAGKTTGGRNLVIRAGELRGKIVAPNGSVQSYPNNSLSIHDISVTPGESLTFSKTTVSNTDNYWRYVYKDKDGALVSRFAKSPNQYTETVPDGASLLTVSYPTDAVVKLERGTVATDWTPAPEDVQSEIDAAKEQATKAQQSTDKLRGYVDGAFRDGVVDDAEAKAIKTYINEVDAQWQSALGAYEKVYQNPLLTGTPKTALLDCKTTLAGKCDALTQYIATAIGDGRATTAEVSGVNTRYNAYKVALRDFQKALKVAEQAIRDATVVEVGSGSLNYLPADVIRSDKNRSLTSLRLAAGFFRAVPVGVEVPINIGYDVYFDNDRTDNKVKTTFFYTDEKDNYSQGSRRYIHYSITAGLKGRAWHHIWKSGKVARLDKHVRIMGWLADTSDIGTYPSEVRNVYLRVGSRDLGWTPAPEDVQAEIDAERSARETAVREVRSGLANTDTLVSALEKAQSKLAQGILTKADTKDIQYLLDSLKNGDTQVAGGLVLSNDIILSDPNSKDVTATISGTQTEGANVMRLGISYTCDEDKKATVERAGAKWGINLSSILTGLESDSDRIRKLDELGFTIVGGRSLAWPKWEICKATDAKEGGEATALANDGTGHIGELYFWGESIGFGATDKRYMQIGGTARSEYDMVNASTVIRKFGISGGTVRKSGTFVLDRFDSRYSNREIKYTANLSAWAEARAYRVSDNGGWDPNDHRYHKPEYEEFVRTESSATVQLRLELTRGGSTIKTVTSSQVSVSVSAQGGQFGINEEIPQGVLFADDRKSQDVTITISPSDVREQDTVTLSLVTTIKRYCYHPQGNNEIDRYTSATASAGSIINFLPYDTSQPMVSVTKDRAAFFYGRSKYVLLNYIQSYVMKVVGNMLLQGNLILKGDLTAEYADFPGVPLIGGMVTKEGSFKKSFGRYKNQSGRNFPQASYDYSTKVYTVYHSIGNDKYIPVVTPMDHRWGDTLSISNVSSYSFQVQLTNGNQDRNQCAFTYVCSKAD